MKEVRLTPFTVHMTEASKENRSYGLDLIESRELIEQTGEKGQGVVVAVLDTGCDVHHDDLKDKIIQVANFTNEGRFNDVRDGSGHGTHVAGIISSVAPEASLMVCKVLNSNGSGTYDGIIHGLTYAANWRGKNGERVRVINMSLGGPFDDIRLKKAILRACSFGIVVVVASGNEANGDDETFEISYPSSYNECVTVAACNQSSKIADFSNRHLEVDIVSPGVEIPSTYPGNKYAVLSGTSMATPYVSGALCLIIKVGEKEFRRTLTESEIYALLIKCCCSLGYKKSSEGNGLPKLSRLMAACST
jgi:major intracellular serine protease